MRGTRLLQCRTQKLWFCHISTLLPRQRLSVYRRGESVAFEGTLDEFVVTVDCTTELEDLWAHVYEHHARDERIAA